MKTKQKGPVGVVGKRFPKNTLFGAEFHKEMDDFFAEIDKVIGKEPEPEKCCTICEFSEPGDGCGANEPTETEWLESKAELNLGI